MALSNKTTITTGVIPENILTKACLKIVILADNENIVTKADQVAQSEPLGVERCVIWIKNPDFNSLVEQIPSLNGVVNNLNLFSLSTINKIGMKINIGESTEYFDLDRAFTEAGKSNLN